MLGIDAVGTDLDIAAAELLGLDGDKRALARKTLYRIAKRPGRPPSRRRRPCSGARGNCSTSRKPLLSTIFPTCTSTAGRAI